MLNLYPTVIDELSLHYVGNKNRGEDLFLSKAGYKLTDELIPKLNEYFFKSFREKEEEYFRFDDQDTLENNVIYGLVSEIFDHPEEFHHTSRMITEWLYQQSNHPHIKSGEIYVALLSDCEVDNQRVQAVGIFKSERKDDFMLFSEKEGNMFIDLREGVNLGRLDKGCIVFNMDRPDGYKVLTIDSNRYDTKYWTENFLGLSQKQDENFYTKKYLKLCEEFSNDVIFPNEDRKEQVLFLNKSLDYFAKNDSYKEPEFLNSVIPNPDYQREFKNYKSQFAEDYRIEDKAEFDIKNDAVTAASRKFKQNIVLDTNIEINLKFRDEASARKYLEKGYDQEKGMYYYVVYFNREKN